MVQYGDHQAISLAPVALIGLSNTFFPPAVFSRRVSILLQRRAVINTLTTHSYAVMGGFYKGSCDMCIVIGSFDGRFCILPGIYCFDFGKK